MVDKFSKEVRSRIMASIKGKDTFPELLLRKAIFSKGLRYRTNYRIGPGTTSIDIAFPSKKIAVFVDGTFWHGHNWPKLRKKLKNDFWRDKIKNNVLRDRRINLRLKKEGWKVIRFWDHQIHNQLNSCAEEVFTNFKERCRGDVNC